LQHIPQIKFVILEIVIFIRFLLWIADKLMRDFRMNFFPSATDCPVAQYGPSSGGSSAAPSQASWVHPKLAEAP
jgi:hypothetical protein